MAKFDDDGGGSGISQFAQAIRAFQSSAACPRIGHRQSRRGETPFRRPAPFSILALRFEIPIILFYFPSVILRRFKTVRTLCPPTDPTASGAKRFGSGLLLARYC